MNTGQLAVFVIPRQILKKGQGHLQDVQDSICQFGVFTYMLL